MVSVYGGMSHERKAKIWTMWQQGTPMSHIARDIKKPPATVYSYLLYHGGIEPKKQTNWTRADNDNIFIDLFHVRRLLNNQFVVLSLMILVQLKC